MLRQALLFVLLGFVAALLVSTAAAGPNAGCLSGGATVCYTGADPTAACTAQYFKSGMNNAASQIDLQALDKRFLECEAYANTCCGDPCRLYTDLASCASDPTCVPLPGISATTFTCVQQNKMCALFDQWTCTNIYRFCKWTGGDCVYQQPITAAGAAGTLAPDQTVDAKCPAMNPLVMVMLILMFVTFAAAVGVVAYVVWRNQKLSDEEERKAEAEQFAALARGEARRVAHAAQAAAAPQHSTIAF